MADITKCVGESTILNCPEKDTCYRYKVEAGKNQSWFTHIPYSPQRSSCLNYWPIVDKKLDKVIKLR